MSDLVLEQIIDKSRAARDGHFGVLSTGEKIAAALVLNRADWLAEAGFTMAEAIERLEAEWLTRIPAAARTVKREAGLAQEDASTRKQDSGMEIGF